MDRFLRKSVNASVADRSNAVDSRSTFRREFVGSIPTAGITLLYYKHIYAVMMQPEKSGFGVIVGRFQEKDLSDAHKEQNQKRICNGFQRIIDPDDHIPDPAALEVLRTGGQQRPDF